MFCPTDLNELGPASALTPESGPEPIGMYQTRRLRTPVLDYRLLLSEMLMRIPEALTSPETVRPSQATHKTFSRRAT